MPALLPSPDRRRRVRRRRPRRPGRPADRPAPAWRGRGRGRGDPPRRRPGRPLPRSPRGGGAKTTSLWFLIGFALLFVVEVVTRGHTHHEAGEEHVEHSSLTPFVTGLLLHNFVDGAVLAAGQEASAEVGTAIAIGIVVHQLPVGLSFAAVVATVPGGRERARTWAPRARGRDPSGGSGRGGAAMARRGRARRSARRGRRGSR